MNAATPTLLKNPLALLLAALTLLTSCTKPETRSPRPAAVAASVSERLRVVASHTVAADLVRQIGGDEVDVVCLQEPGREMKDVTRTGPVDLEIRTAQLVVTMGFGQEEGITASLERAKEEGIPLCEVLPMVPAESFLPAAGPGAVEGARDLHVWLDPLAWSRAVEPLAAVMAEARPLSKASFLTRAHAVSYQYRELAAGMKDRVDLVREDRRRLVSSVPELRYVARAAGLPFELGQPDTSREETRLVEGLKFPSLARPGEKVFIRTESHDVGTVAGTIRVALERIVQEIR